MTSRLATRTLLVHGWILGALLTCACKSERTTDHTFADEASRRPNNSRSVRVAFVDGIPTPASAAAMSAMSPAPGPGPGAELALPTSALAWTSPDSWRRMEPASPMRLAQYAIPSHGPGPSAELAVYYFGPAGVATIDQTLQRWQSSFDDGGRAERSVRKTPELTVHVLDVTGTYNADAPAALSNADAGAGKHRSMRLVGAIVETSQGPYYFKMIGPDASVAAARTALIGMLVRARMASVAEPAPAASASAGAPPP